MTETMTTADHLMRHGHWATAIALLAGVVRADPEDAGAWTRLGVCYSESGYQIEAIDALMHALTLGISPEDRAVPEDRVSPEDRAAPGARGLRRLAQPGAAAAARCDTCHALGCAWLRRGETETARDWFVQALRTEADCEQRLATLDRLVEALELEERHEAAAFVRDEPEETWCALARQSPRAPDGRRGGL